MNLKSTAKFKRVRSVQLSIFSPDEVRARSVVEVYTPFTYTDGVPVTHGLNDLRMGTTDFGY